MKHNLPLCFSRFNKMLVVIIEGNVNKLNKIIEEVENIFPRSPFYKIIDNRLIATDLGNEIAMIFSYNSFRNNTSVKLIL